MKIAIIGAGNLGQSIAHGILGQSEIGCDTLYLTKRNTADLAQFNNHDKVIVTSDNAEATKLSDVILLCVQPGQLVSLLEEITPFSKEKLVISTITGKKINDIENILGNESAIIRSMPNTAISVGQSMTCLSANKHGHKQILIAEKIFNALGNTLIVEESMMQAATVVCASGIAFWMRLIRATTQGAIQLGFDAPEAKNMAVQTCLGAASLLQQSNTHPEQEIDKVTTPKGCTISGLNEMEHQGLSSALIKGLVKSYDKINDLK
jgi:pyrroline-5-carboxylate reductase